MTETLATQIAAYVPRMYRVALRIVGGSDAARDVAQDACVRALQGAAKYDSRAALSTWLHRITVNCAHDYARKSRRSVRCRTDWDGDASGVLALIAATPAERAEQNDLYRLAPAQNGEPLRQPIAVVLRLSRDLSCPGRDLAGPKTYVIVCRSHDAAIPLPPSALAQAVRLRLLPTAANGEVDLQYAIAAEGSGRAPDDAGLAGRRRVGVEPSALGQLALNDCLVSVDASAWVIGDPHQP